MKRTLFVMAVVLGFATAASAATLTVTSDKATYGVGETITLFVSGDGEGATSYGVIGRLLYSAALTEPLTVVEEQVGPGYTPSGAVTIGDGFAEAFNQFAFPAAAATNLPGINPFSTITLVAEAIGIVSFDWSDSLDFLGILGAQSANLSIEIVPEPTTAVLLGLGLFGLALGGRRRS